MTEDEARQKWCPFTRIAWYNQAAGKYSAVGFNRSVEAGPEGIDEGYSKGTYCIASDCMMWRWDLMREEAESGFVAKNGYCGLAGKP